MSVIFEQKTPSWVNFLWVSSVWYVMISYGISSHCPRIWSFLKASLSGMLQITNGSDQISMAAVASGDLWANGVICDS